ncbi:MAG: hypothetical protein ACE5D8_04470 [Fidelibacterota bacterium]
MSHKSAIFLIWILTYLQAAFELHPDEQFFMSRRPPGFLPSHDLSLNLSLERGRPFRLPGLYYHQQQIFGSWTRHRFRLAHFQYGNTIYTESTLALQYGYQVRRPLLVSLSLQNYSLRIRDYGQARTWGLSLELAGRVRSDLHWRFALRNINQPRIGRSREELPVVARLETRWQPLAFLTGHVRWTQDLSRGYDPLESAIWLIYSPSPRLQCLSGYARHPTRILGSVSFSWLNCSFFYEIIYYHDLTRFSTRTGLSLVLDLPGKGLRTK